MLPHLHNPPANFQYYEAASQPTALFLAANYPNPFNATTAIRYALPAAGPVQLSVYALNGQQVRTLVQGAAAPGWHVVRWDGRDEAGRAVASGAYLYRLAAVGGWCAERRACGPRFAFAKRQGALLKGCPSASTLPQ